MAVNKRKVLDAARKYAQKGAKEKALKEYHTLLKLDPRDAKLHLEIGDCYRRWGQIDEAVTQYARVADQYKGDGFDARAVAVFKQILNLDPKNYGAYVSLAELYQRMGLESEALGALQSAADGYHKEGQKREALDLLRRMATLDPTNTTSRLKVAELLRQEGMEDDAISEYEAVSAELSKQGATESFISVQERILDLRPERSDVLLAIARGLIELKNPERAEPFARRALEKDSDDTNIHELLLDIYKSLGNDKELASTTRLLAQTYRERGDDDKARELSQRIPAAFQIEDDGEQRTVDVTESAFLTDDELLDEDFLETEEPDELEVDDDAGDVLLDDDANEEPPEPEPEPVAPPRPAPQGDPDQLLAEASVYLRYGKRDQAIASLEALLGQDPDHRAGLEKMGDAHAETDDAGEAVVYWSRAAELARREQDASTFEVLRDRIAALDAEAAEALGSIGIPDLDDEPEPESIDTIEETDALESEAEATQSDLEDEVELDVDVDLDLAVDSEDEFDVDVDVETADEADADAGADESGEFEVELDLGDEGAAEEDHAEVDDDGLDLSEMEAEDDVSIDVVDDDESAADAGADLDDVFEIEIDGAADDGSDEEPDAAEDAADEMDVELDLDADPEEEAVAADAAGSAETGSDSQLPGLSISSSQRVSEDLEEAEFYYQQQLMDEAEGIYQRVLDVAPQHPLALLRLGEIDAAKGDDPSPASDAAVDVAADEDFEVEEPSAALDEEAADDFALDDDSGDDGLEELEIDLEEDEDEHEPDEPALELSEPEPEEDTEPALDPVLEQDEDAAGDEPDEAAIALDLDDEEPVDDTTEVEEDVPEEDDGPSMHDDSTEVADVLDIEEPDEPVVQIDAPPRKRPRLGDVETAGPEETTMQLPDRGPAQAEDTQPVFEDGGQPLAAAGGEDEGLFDLAAELRDVIEDDAADSSAVAASAPSTVDDGFESIFADFKQGVSATLSEDDYETRYDLGIAYREMELYQDAIGEFQHCLASPVRKVSSLQLMGLCALDLGQAQDATNHLQQALAGGDLPVEQRAGIQFDLGRAFEAIGDAGRARAAYEAVLADDPGFPGAEERLAGLDSAGGDEGGAPSADEGGTAESYETFDDLVADANETPAAPEESFESFDDVILEADAEPVEDADPVDDDAADDDAEADPNASSGTDAPKSKSRRKKISFV